MKLEIDISDRVQLGRAMAELTRLLKIVEFALAEVDSSKTNGTNGILNLVHYNVAAIGTSSASAKIGAVDGQVIGIIQGLPKKFSTSDVMIGMGDKAKENRSAVKFALKRAVSTGIINVLKPGQGRRPTKYEKIEKIQADK